MNRLKNGVIATYLTYFIQVVISLFVSPIIIENLGQSLYGVYEIALAVSAYIGILNFGIPHSFLKFSAIEREKNKSNRTDRLNFVYFITVFLLSILALIIGILISCFGMPFFASKLTTEELTLCKNAIFLLSVNSAIGIFSQAFETYILSFERYATSKIIGCCKSVLTSGLSITALFLGYSLKGVIIASVFVSVLGLMFMFFYCYKHLDLRLKYDKSNKYHINPLFSYSFLIFINLIVDQVNWSIDKALLGAMSGTISTAIYGVGARFHNMFMQIMIAISGVFVAKIYAICAEKSVDKDNKLNDIFLFVGRLQFMLAGLVIIGFALFGKLFIEMWVGPEYFNSYYIGLILIVSSTHLYIQNIGLEIQRAKNLHKFRAYTYIGMSLFNLLISIVLIKSHGEIGAATGTAISLIVCDGFITNVYYYKKVGLDIKRFWKKILKLTISVSPSAIIGYIIMSFVKPDTFLKSIPAMCIVVIIYLICLYSFGIDKSERKTINKHILDAFK